MNLFSKFHVQNFQPKINIYRGTWRDIIPSACNPVVSCILKLGVCELCNPGTHEDYNVKMQFSTLHRNSHIVQWLTLWAADRKVGGMNLVTDHTQGWDSLTLRSFSRVYGKPCVGVKWEAAIAAVSAELSCPLQRSRLNSGWITIP